MGAFDVDLGAVRRRHTVKWTAHEPDVLAAWVAEMDFDAAPVVRDAVAEAVTRQDFGYAQADLTPLTGALARFVERFHGWSIDPSGVFVVADVLAGIAAALEHHAPPGAPVVVPTPAYPPFFEIVALGGRPVVEVPCTTDGDRPVLDLGGIDAALAAGAGVVLLCNPHNPVGRAYQPEELLALSEVVERNGAQVVADELHGPLVHPEHRATPYSSVSAVAASHSTTVVSASKAWNVPGLKCAQVVTTNPEATTWWHELPDFAVPGPAPIGIAAAIAAYTEGEPWLGRLRTRLAANRDLLDALLDSELPGVRHHPAEASYLAWIDCTQLGLERPAEFFLESARVALNDGAAFGRGFERCVRLNFGTSPEVLTEIVRRMADALAAR